MRRAPVSAALLVLALSLCDSGCFTARYLARQGVDQLQLLRARRRVNDVLVDPRTPPFLRERLRLAKEARRFGVEVLGLRGGAEFTRFLDTKGPVAFNLSAAEKTRLRGKAWRFPLVGQVPYLGFFSLPAALSEARRLEADGYDIYVRPVGGYSSLGYLLSPIYASMIDEPGPRGEVRAVETLLHEMAHTTVWLPSASDLNESYATVVGYRGAVLFFERRGGAAADLVADMARRRRDSQGEEKRNQAFSTWLRGAMGRLSAFYKEAEARGLPRARILADREEIFREITASFQATFPGQMGRLSRGPLNNALLLSFGVYLLGDAEAQPARRAGLSGRRLQEALLASVGGDLRAYIALYRRAGERADGAAWLRWRAQESGGETSFAPYHQN